jgi:hypothetical protein
LLSLLPLPPFISAPRHRYHLLSNYNYTKTITPQPPNNILFISI